MSYLCEVQQHPCGWISDDREVRVEWRRSAVEQRVDMNFSLSHSGEDDNTTVFKYLCLLSILAF